MGGAAYRSLKLLLIIVVGRKIESGEKVPLLIASAGYSFSLHLFGAICLVGWIQYAEPKYRDYPQECGKWSVWWYAQSRHVINTTKLLTPSRAFYSAQSMVDNLGFTLTPDSMMSFRDATFPVIVMSFLAYAGNTLYPCVLRLVIWVIYKCVPANSSLKISLVFLKISPSLLHAPLPLQAHLDPVRHHIRAELRRRPPNCAS